MRQLWLEKIDTKEIWNCIPKNPYDTEGGCLFANPQGLGYEQEITQNQINVDYFISQIKSKNQEVIVTAYFNGNQHLQNFVSFIGDFSNQMYLYYSPDGSIEPYDQISKPYYKPVVISSFEKGEMNTAGWYVCNIKFKSQSDVWRKDWKYTVQNTGSIETQDLVYPYTYPYVYGSSNLIAINIDNNGRETGCIVRILNKSNDVASNFEWFVEHIVVDRYGNTETEIQRAKFFVYLQHNYVLYVDSNSTTQEAKVVFTNNTSQTVVNQQEPSWDYINFVSLKHGTNRFVFNPSNKNVDIQIEYAELKEVV